MASVGPQSPTAAAEGSAGIVSWTTITNVYSSDDSRAICSLGGANTTTKTILATGFDFSTIPSGATIDGIVVEIERHASSTSGSPRDLSVYLTKNGTATVGANKATGTTLPTSDAYATYGGAADLWSTTWTDSEIKASTFGLYLQYQKTTGETNTTIRVDHIRITVYYTAAAGGLSIPVVMNQYRQRRA